MLNILLFTFFWLNILSQAKAALEARIRNRTLALRNLKLHLALIVPVGNNR